LPRRTRRPSRSKAPPPALPTAERRLRLPASVGWLGALFAIKFAVLWQLKDHILLQPDAGLDTSVYLTLAERVAAGDIALGPGLYFVSPLYIYFAAVVLALTKSITAIRIVQIALGTVAVGLVWWTARQWASPRAAWLAAGLASLTGLFTFYEVLLLQAAIDSFLTSMALAALTAALTRWHTVWFAAAGIVFGIQTLNRPNVAVAAAGVIVLLIVIRRWRSASAMAAGLLIALVPVTIRNAAIAGDWSPVSSHGGLNFYIGNNPEADGTYVTIQGITPSIEGQHEDARRVAQEAVGRRLEDAEVSAYFYGRGTAWIRDEPAAAAALFARKLAYTFNSAHLSLNFSYPFYAHDAGTLLRVLFVGPWLLIPLGVVGLSWLAWTERSAPFAIWAAFVPLYAIAVALFFVSERYRLPLLVPLCVGGGAAVDSVVSGIAARRGRVTGVLMGGFVLAAIAANWPMGLDGAQAEERTRMAERSAFLNRLEEAEIWAAKAEQIHPTPGVLHFRVGRALLRRGHTDAALGHLRKSAEIDATQPEVDFALGQALLQSGRAAEAVPHLRRAYDTGVRADLSGFDLARALAASGDGLGALEVLQNVRPALADDADSWYALGQLAQQLGNLRLAARYYGEAARAAPRASDPREQLGLVLALLGDFEAAVRELELAVKLNPSDATARLNLAAGFAQLGRKDEARVQAREALRLDPGYLKARELLNALNK
jgi:Flp pilus assembly protein TadD